MIPLTVAVRSAGCMSRQCSGTCLMTLEDSRLLMPTFRACGDRAGKVGRRWQECRSFYEVDAETPCRLSRRQSVHQRPVLRLALALLRGQRKPIVRCPGARQECLQVSCPSLLPCESTVATSTCSSLLRLASQSRVLASMGWCGAPGAPAPSPAWGHPDCNCGSAGETGKDAREPNRVRRGTVVWVQFPVGSGCYATTSDLPPC